jgi:hypothetical protein
VINLYVCTAGKITCLVGLRLLMYAYERLVDDVCVSLEFLLCSRKLARESMRQNYAGVMPGRARCLCVHKLGVCVTA